MPDRIPTLENRTDTLESDFKEFESWQRKQDKRLNEIEINQAVEIHIIKETIQTSLAPFSSSFDSKINDLDNRLQKVENAPHTRNTETVEKIKWLVLGAIVPTIVSIILAKMGII